MTCQGDTANVLQSGAFQPGVYPLSLNTILSQVLASKDFNLLGEIFTKITYIKRLYECHTKKNSFFSILSCKVFLHCLKAIEDMDNKTAKSFKAKIGENVTIKMEYSWLLNKGPLYLPLLPIRGFSGPRTVYIIVMLIFTVEK